MDTLMKYNFKILAIVILTLFQFSGITQKVVISENPPLDFRKERSEFGPNQKRFDYLDLKLGDFKSGVATNTIPTKSTLNLELTKLYKRKISELFSLNYGIGIGHQLFVLEQYDITYLPDISDQSKEIKYRFINLHPIMGFQINLDNKRGNQMGKYIACNAYLDWIFSDQLSYKYTNSSNSDQIKITHKNLSNVSAFQYGVKLKISGKKLGVFVDYRVSDYFINQSYELPKLSIGVNYSIYKNNYR